MVLNLRKSESLTSDFVHILLLVMIISFNVLGCMLLCISNEKHVKKQVFRFRTEKSQKLKVFDFGSFEIFEHMSSCEKYIFHMVFRAQNSEHFKESPVYKRGLRKCFQNTQNQLKTQDQIWQGWMFRRWSCRMSNDLKDWKNSPRLPV